MSPRLLDRVPSSPASLPDSDPDRLRAHRRPVSPHLSSFPWSFLPRIEIRELFIGVRLRYPQCLFLSPFKSCRSLGLSPPVFGFSASPKDILLFGSGTSFFRLSAHSPSSGHSCRGPSIALSFIPKLQSPVNSSLLLALDTKTGHLLAHQTLTPLRLPHSPRPLKPAFSCHREDAFLQCQSLSVRPLPFSSSVTNYISPRLPSEIPLFPNP